MKHVKMKKILLATTALSLSSISHMAYSDEGQLEEIVVTAQKREQNLQTVPVSVTAFSADDLKNFGISQPIDLVSHTPGLYAKPTVGDQNPVFTIRGVGFNDFTPIQSPGTAIYVNQVVVPYHPMLSFQLFDTERVEVLKGPQGTLYGRNSTAGAINFVSRKPSQESSGNIRFDYSSWNTFDVDGAFGGALSETLSARVAISVYERTGGYQTNRVGNDDSYGSKDRLAGRAMFLWEPSEDVDVLLDIHGGRDNSDPVALEHLGSVDSTTWTEPCAPVAAGNRSEGTCINYGAYFDADGDPHSGDYSVTDGGLDNDAWGFSATANWDLGDTILTSVTGYDAFTRNQLQDIDASPFVFLDVTFTDRTWALSQELRLTSDTDTQLSWIVGGFYSKDSVDAEQSVDATDLVGTKAVITNDQESYSMAVFAHMEYEINNALSLIGGLRYTHENKKWTGGSDFVGVLAISASDEITEDDLSGQIGIQYNTSDDVMLYATASKSFRSGGFPGGFTLNPSALTAFDPEQVYAYEAGFKSTLAEGAMRFNGAVYYYDWKNLQTQFSEERDGFISLFLGNAGDAEIYGAEVDLLWAVSKQLDLSAGINVMSTKIKTSPDARLIDKELANAPDVTFNAMARYTVPLKGANLLIQADTSYTSDRFFTSDNTPVFHGDAFWLLNARISYQPDSAAWEVAAWARNVGNKNYRTEGFNQFGFAGSSYHAYGEPRSYGVSMSYQF